MSTTTTDEIQKLKFAILEAELHLAKARQAATKADVDVRVLWERLKMAQDAGEIPAYPKGALTRAPADAEALMRTFTPDEAAPRQEARPDLFALKIDLATEDRVAAVRVLRRLAADIEEGDATGWSVSGIEGSAVATPYTPTLSAAAR